MKYWKPLFYFLFLLSVLSSVTLFSRPDGKLHLIACDVGQGDAILAVMGRTQILVDGGPDEKVLSCLSRHLPYDDREIELVILTHPETDHFGGLISVFERYRVGSILANGLDAGSKGYQVLKKVVGGSSTKVLFPESSRIIRLGKIYIDILHPSLEYLLVNSEYPSVKNESNVLGAYASGDNPNSFSIVAKLSLGNFDALLPGDIAPETEGYLLSKGLVQPAEYIKVPHHGSKNGLTESFLKAVEPKIAVISVGRDNRYGFPNKDILEMLRTDEVKTLRTDEGGDIEIVTDGNTWEEQ